MDQPCIVALALAAAMPQSSILPLGELPPPGLTCEDTTPTSPLIDDCIKAFELVEPVTPIACALIWLPQSNFRTVGTCTVRTYSAFGRANCLNRSLIRGGILDILAGCSDDTFTQGSYTWTAEGDPVEGVRLMSAAWVLEEWVLRGEIEHCRFIDNYQDSVMSV